MTAENFPRQTARTRRFTLGEPRAFLVCAQRLLFLRSHGGDDALTCLWSYEFEANEELGHEAGPRLLVNPAQIGADEDETPAERSRRERAREMGSGITSFAADDSGELIAFALAGRLFVCDATTGSVGEAPVETSVFDPRLSPDGARIAYTAGRALRIVGARVPEDDRVLALDDDADISWGTAEFIASEEFHRFRGHWWSPDGSRLLAARVDLAGVDTWHIGDPTDPAVPPLLVRYPGAGTANADVTLHVIDVVDGHKVQVEWDRATFPYVIDAHWSQSGPRATVLDRSQHILRVLTIDPDSGATTLAGEVQDECWVEVIPGVPDVLGDGRLVLTIDGHVSPPPPQGLTPTEEQDWWPDPEMTRALAISIPGGRPSVTETVRTDVRIMTPANLQVRSVAHVGADYVVFTASQSRPRPTPPGAPLTESILPVDPGAVAVLRLDLRPDGKVRLTPLAGKTNDPGVHSAWAAGDVVVIRSASLARERAEFRVLRIVSNDKGVKVLPIGEIANLAEEPVVRPAPSLLRAGPRSIPTAVFTPSDPDLWGDGLEKLPVLLDPYGGPHGQRVVQSRTAHLTSQWFADQGFIVVVADGRGTPGVGPAWEKAIYRDLLNPALDDQAEALEYAAGEFPQMDLERVAIRGWSFGGYLAAAAVLRRPDTFHAAVAGAPVVDWHLYDSAYTERYLGNPHDDERPYDACSLIPDAPYLARPLLLIHGLADDNVVAAHTLRLSAALMAAGRPHEVLPLPGVTHMATGSAITENLLGLELDFIRRALGVPDRS